MKTDHIAVVKAENAISGGIKAGNDINSRRRS